MLVVHGSPRQGLFGATLGFFIGFAAVSLFGPTVQLLQRSAALSIGLAGLLISIPSLSGSLLRIPFSAMVDITGGRRPFLILLSLAAAGLLGIWILLGLRGADLREVFPLLLFFGILGGCGIATFSVGVSQTSYWFPQGQQGTALGIYAGVGNLAPGLFTFLLSNVSLPLLGLSGSYLAWLVFLLLGTGAYLLLGRNSPYFQFRAQGLERGEAIREARARGQELFPKASTRESLLASARVGSTWILVLIYFTTFGGFIALTGWFPKYWTSYFGLGVAAAGALAAGYSVLTSLARLLGGWASDRLGGQGALAGALLLMSAAAALLGLSASLGLSAAAAGLLALGMGVGNGAVFKLVAQEVPQAIGGAAGWVGGLGALGGFVLPNVLVRFLRTDLPGDPGYASGFMVFVLLGLLSLGLVALLARRSARRKQPA